MSWRNIRLIYAREIRDQLRDRRTLFMIAVLPLLLYPLLGMSVFQLSQFLRKSEPKVLVIGSEQLTHRDDIPALFEGDRFAAALFDAPEDANRLQVEFVNPTSESKDSSRRDHEVSAGEPSDSRLPEGAFEAALGSAQRRLKSGDVQVVLVFPSDFGERLHVLREEIRSASTRVPLQAGQEAEGTPKAIEIPEPELMYNSAREKSRVAHAQIWQILSTWKSQIVRDNLLASRVPANAAKPFTLKPRDIADRDQQEAALWSKILPFVLFIWALTGAFYPAVDLCAGEKERGTLETLLSSPALRSEIVWGKLLTVMTFSVATALLNLLSLGFTAQYIVGQLRMLPAGDFAAGLDLPPLGALFWLLVALLPMSALFSALCLACAAFARSTKEGQYYLMPLLLVTMPLMMLPMAPGAELDLGNSLIPVTGVVLLIRGLVQGNFADVLPYVVPVVAVTLACCLFAIRWAVYQFSQESVLFRESERFSLRHWLIHLVRDRQSTPSLAEAFFGVVLIYVIQFFANLAMTANAPPEPSFAFFSLTVIVSQVLCIALPAVCMALVLTSKPSKSLLLRHPPNFASCLAAIAIAVVWHPLGHTLVGLISKLYPLSEELQAQSQSMMHLLGSAPYSWLPFLLIAVLPAICEELAFRGFVLSGLRHLGHKWWAIGLSAVFFGLAHTVIQQSIAATAVGLVIGYLAVQTGSLVPCILFHMTYNSLMLLSTRWPELLSHAPALKVLVAEGEAGGLEYNWPVLATCSVLAVGLLAWFQRLPFHATREETLSVARSRQSGAALHGTLAGATESNGS